MRKDALLVKELEIKPGQAFYVCTYERNEPGYAQADNAFDAASAEDCCDFILGKGIFADFEKPVSAACALADASGNFATAMK